MGNSKFNFIATPGSNRTPSLYVYNQRAIRGEKFRLDRIKNRFNDRRDRLLYLTAGGLDIHTSQHFVRAALQSGGERFRWLGVMRLQA